MKSKPFPPQADPNCISTWFPPLQRSGVPVPKTELLHTDLPLFRLAYNDPVAGFEGFERELRQAVERMGLPCILRTGHGSGKHQWEETCFLANVDHLRSHIYRLVEWTQIVDIVGLPTNVWAVRELLPTEPAFHAPAFGNMPVCRERRYFLSGGQVIAHVPYWPVEAMMQGCTVCWNPRVLKPPDWREKLQALNQETPDEVAELTRLSKQVGRHFDGDWSLDWLHTTRGWYAIDMARAQDSWACPEELSRSDEGNEPCPNIPKHQPRPSD